MNKFLVSGLVSLVAMVAIPLSVSAAPVVNGMTDVTGTVTYSNNPVDGAHVTVVCNGNQGTDTTDSAGDYLVVFKSSQCPANATVSVTATKGEENGTDTGTANKLNTKLNIAMVDVSVALPEMGVATGAVAIAAAGGTVLVTRRRRFENK